MNNIIIQIDSINIDKCMSVYSLLMSSERSNLATVNQIPVDSQPTTTDTSTPPFSDGDNSLNISLSPMDTCSPTPITANEMTVYKQTPSFASISSNNAFLENSYP